MGRLVGTEMSQEAARGPLGLPRHMPLSNDQLAMVCALRSILKLHPTLQDYDKVCGSFSLNSPKPIWIGPDKVL